MTAPLSADPLPLSPEHKISLTFAALAAFLAMHGRDPDVDLGGACEAAEQEVRSIVRALQGRAETAERALRRIAHPRAMQGDDPWSAQIARDALNGVSHD